MDSSVWWYIALAIVIIALVVAGIGVFLFIKGMKEPLKKIKGAVDDLKERMDRLKLETSALSHHANELKEDMQVKSEKVTVFIDAAKGTKNSVLDLNSLVRTKTDRITSQVDHDRQSIAQADQWSNTVVGLANFWKDRKAAKKRASEPLLIPISGKRPQ
jgi:uncharacterized protein YoxC